MRIACGAIKVIEILHLVTAVKLFSSSKVLGSLTFSALNFSFQTRHTITSIAIFLNKI